MVAGYESLSIGRYALTHSISYHRIGELDSNSIRESDLNSLVLNILDSGKITLLSAPDQTRKVLVRQAPKSINLRRADETWSSTWA